MFKNLMVAWAAVLGLGGLAVIGMVVDPPPPRPAEAPVAVEYHLTEMQELEQKLGAQLEKMRVDPDGEKADNCQWREENTSAADAKLCWMELEEQIRRRKY